MPRYIDADKAKHDVLFLFSRNKELIDEWLVFCVDEVFDEQPTADVVQVVRCKDCCKWCICHHSDDYFCADGERREEE